MRVKLSSLPDPPALQVVNLDRLDGGLNLWDLDYRMEADQSPSMKNMYWVDGALGSRKGQAYLYDTSLGSGYAMYEDLFQDRLILHIGSRLYALDPNTGEIIELGVTEEEVLTPIQIPENRGTFFRYGDNLYYKNIGSYTEITGALTATAVVGYTPTIVINASPTNGSGDTYQPENRIQAQKTVWYNAVSGTTVYHLPVTGLDSVDAVVVDGVTEDPASEYTVDLEAGTVTFVTSPPVTDPATNNTVRITFTKENEEAYNSVMACRYASVYGGDTNICVVLAGCTAQPNAYFWSGNNVAMDPTYFPMDFYNLAGDSAECITGFGRQQGLLIVLKEKSIGKATYGVTTVSDRDVIEMPYVSINSRIGCDLPWTIQLVENNLAFCNTEQGVYIVLNTTSADENNVMSISRNVNGGDLKPGLLADLRAVSADLVASVDDGSRYWVVANGHAYLWDYELRSYRSDVSKLSWFYFENITGVAFAQHLQETYYLGSAGKVTKFIDSYTDYGGAIEREYMFAVQDFGGYYRLKDVVKVVFTIRSDTNSRMDIEYNTDYETREDSSPVLAYSYSLVPRNLTYRILSVIRYAYTAVRRPGCKHIRHFSMRLYNNAAGQDMSLISAQIFFNLQGVDR